MEWITIEEFNKDPQEGYYWVYIDSRMSRKSILEFYDGWWFEEGEFFELSFTHVIPIKEPDDPI